MHLHGGFREVKRTGDFLIGNAAGQPRQNLTFTGRKRLHVRSRGREVRVAPQFHYELTGHLWRNDRVTRHGVAHALQQKVRVNLL